MVRVIVISVLAVLGLAVLGFILNSAGLIGHTVVEREVFEQSYQRQAGLQAQIATDEAALVEIEGQLRNPNLDENTRFNLEAQAAAARVRIRTAREQLR